MQSHRWLHSARVCMCVLLDAVSYKSSTSNKFLWLCHRGGGGDGRHEYVERHRMCSPNSNTITARYKATMHLRCNEINPFDWLVSSKLNIGCICLEMAIRIHRISIHIRFTGPATRCALRIQLAISTLYLHQTSISKLRDLVFGSRHAAVHTSCLTVINTRSNPSAAYVRRSSSNRFTGIYVQLNTMYCVEYCSIFRFWAFAIYIFIELK